MVVLVIILLAVCILIPLIFAWRIWRLDVGSKAGWLAIVGDALVFCALIFIVGRWDMAGYYTRFVLIGVLTVSMLWSFRKHASRPWLEGGFKELWRKHWTTAVSLVPFSAVLVYVLVGLISPPHAQSLAFPIAGGRLMVGQAGGNGLLNHHAGHPAQRHAADIGAIFPTGFRADGILPTDLEAYAVYGLPVVSPCAGEVISAADNLPDLIPPERDSESAIGNHVIIDCGDFNVELAHLMQDSVTVEADDVIFARAPLGRVGNWGNTTEPHLHIHAVDTQTGLGVPMSFDGSTPARNSVYDRRVAMPGSS